MTSFHKFQVKKPSVFGNGYYPYNKPGVELEWIAGLDKAEKKEQWLFFYNVSVLWRLGRTGEWFQRVDEDSPIRNTVFVLDFDKSHCKEELVRKSFERFRNSLNGNALLVKSFSGFHVVYVLEGDVRKEYWNIQISVVLKYFCDLLDELDVGVCGNHRNGFFHSQHVERWVKEGVVNIDKSASSWFTFGAKLEDLDLSFGCEDAFGLWKAWRKYGDDSKRGGRRIADAASGKLRGILAISEHRNNEKLYTKSLEGTENGERQAFWDCVKSYVCNETVKDEGVPSVSGNVGLRTVRCGAMAGEGHAGGGGTYINRSLLQRNSKKINGHIGSDSVRNEGNKEAGLYGRGGSGRFLEFVQAVQLLCEQRAVDTEVLGYFLSEDCLRSHRYWSIKSEKSDFQVFFGIVRQVLERDHGLGRNLRTEWPSVSEWLRCAEVCLGADATPSNQHGYVAKLANKGFGLYLATHGLWISRVRKVVLSEHKYNFESAKLVKDVIEATDIDTLACSGRAKNFLKNKFKNGVDWLEAGAKKLLTYFAQFWGLVLNGRPIGLGVGNISDFFQCKNLSECSAIRAIFMSILSSKKTAYVPKVKQTQYFMEVEALKRYFVSVERDEERKGNIQVPDTASELASKLGDGNTFETFRRYAKPMFRVHGYERSLEMWHQAIDLSKANDKHYRHGDIERFVEKIARQENEAIKEDPQLRHRIGVAKDERQSDKCGYRPEHSELRMLPPLRLFSGGTTHRCRRLSVSVSDLVRQPETESHLSCDSETTSEIEARNDKEHNSCRGSGVQIPRHDIHSVTGRLQMRPIESDPAGGSGFSVHQGERPQQRSLLLVSRRKRRLYKRVGCNPTGERVDVQRRDGEPSLLFGDWGRSWVLGKPPPEQEISGCG